MDDLALTNIGSNLQASLTELDLRDCPNITANGISTLISFCTHLTELRLRGATVDDSCLYAAARHLSQLRILDLQRSSNVSPIGVHMLAGCSASNEREESVCRRSLRLVNLLGLPLLTLNDVELLLMALPNAIVRSAYDIRPY